MLWVPWEQPPGCADRKSEDAKKQTRTKRKIQRVPCLPKSAQGVDFHSSLLSRLQVEEKALKLLCSLEPWAQPEGTVFLFFVSFKGHLWNKGLAPADCQEQWLQREPSERVSENQPGIPYSSWGGEEARPREMGTRPGAQEFDQCPCPCSDSQPSPALPKTPPLQPAPLSERV